MSIALTTLCLIIVALALLLPINHQKQSSISYAPIFAFLSLLLGFTFSQFSLWYQQLSLVVAHWSVSHFGEGFIRDQGFIVMSFVLWTYGLYLTTQPTQRLLHQVVLFLFSSVLFAVSLHTQILIGHWADLGVQGADDVAGIIGDVGGIAIGFISFIMAVFFAYRLIRSLRRELLSKPSIQSERKPNANER